MQINSNTSSSSWTISSNTTAHQFESPTHIQNCFSPVHTKTGLLHSPLLFKLPSASLGHSSFMPASLKPFIPFKVATSLLIVPPSQLASFLLHLHFEVLSCSLPLSHHSPISGSPAPASFLTPNKDSQPFVPGCTANSPTEHWFTMLNLVWIYLYEYKKKKVTINQRFVPL